MNEVNLGDSENPRPILISSSLNGKERDAHIELLNEFKDLFAWSYKEMPGLDISGGSLFEHTARISPSQTTL